MSHRGSEADYPHAAFSNYSPLPHGQSGYAPLADLFRYPQHMP